MVKYRLEEHEGLRPGRDRQHRVHVGAPGHYGRFRGLVMCFSDDREARSVLADIDIGSSLRFAWVIGTRPATPFASLRVGLFLSRAD